MSNKEQSELEESKVSLEELEAHPLLQGNGLHICSDGTEVSYRTTPRNIRTKMFHLPVEELEEVLDMNRTYQSLRGKRTILRRVVKGESIFQQNKHLSECLKRSQELLDLFGKMYNSSEVHKIVVSEWELYDVKYEHILDFQRKNTDTISKLRDEYMKDTSSVRLVHKRSRLDELTQLYQSRKNKYSVTEYKSDYELMLKTLEQIRKEVEGNRLTINGKIQVEHELAVQDHVNNEILKTLNINDIIIGRLCARLGVSPKYILYRLHTSYYKKYTGFLPNEMAKDGEQIVYPSQTVYDFTRIKELNKVVEIEGVKYKEEPTPNSLSTVVKKKLLSTKLQEVKDNLQSQKKNITNTDGRDDNKLNK